MASMKQFEEFLAWVSIPYSLPSSEDFQHLCASFNGAHQEHQPALVARPQTVEHVVAIMKERARNNVPIVIRGGGHDLFGRFQTPGAVTIDLRALNSTTVSSDRQTATFGGGTTFAQAFRVMREYGVQAPFGNCADVGYTSWSTMGGIGPTINSYGFGSDHIVAVKLVNAEGELVVANAEMLKILRGGGAYLGIIVEMTVKVYPARGLQLAMVAFESWIIGDTIEEVFTNYNRMVEADPPPRELNINFMIMKPPGRIFTLHAGFMWNGPLTNETYVWFDRVVNLGQPILGPGQIPTDLMTMDATPVEYLEMIPPAIAWGKCQSASLSHFSPEAISTIARVADAEAEVAFNFIIMRGDSPACGDNHPDSVLPYRSARIWVEMLTVATEKNGGEKASAAALKARNELAKVDVSMEQVYFPISAPEYAAAETIYSTEMLGVMRQAKRKYDPQDVFGFALPRITL